RHTAAAAGRMRRPRHGSSLLLLLASHERRNTWTHPAGRTCLRMRESSCPTPEASGALREEGEEEEGLPAV
ncbi:hypothetical protein LTR60_005267, partial [Cryomyces antarcticus]